MDFYGRAAELEALEASYAEDKFSFYVVYGRRGLVRRPYFINLSRINRHYTFQHRRPMKH